MIIIDVWNILKFKCIKHTKYNVSQLNIHLWVVTLTSSFPIIYNKRWFKYTTIFSRSGVRLHAIIHNAILALAFPLWTYTFFTKWLWNFNTSFTFKECSTTFNWTLLIRFVFLSDKSKFQIPQFSFKSLYQ